MFSQAANVDRLLTMLRNMDPARDNLADNEEIQVCLVNPIGRNPVLTGICRNYTDLA